MRIVNAVRPPLAAGARLQSLSSRQPGPALLRSAAKPHRPSAARSESCKLLKVCAAASFSSGAGEASFSKGRQEAGVDGGADSGTKGLKVAAYIFLWYGANIYFNIVNKQLLNAFPAPYFIATMQLVGSGLVGLLLWAMRLQKAPKMEPALWKALAPVALFHTLGHVTACVAFGAMAVSFAHIVKSAEPVFSVLLSAPLLGTSYPPLAVWASLLPIIGGCAMSSLNEVTFSWPGFLNASASNVGMVLRNIVSKKMMGQFKSLGGINIFILLSTVATVYCAPLAYFMESHKWSATLEAAKASVGSQHLYFLMALSALLYTAYNVFSYLVLPFFSPVTLSVGNSMKRVAVVISSVLFFRNPVSPLNWAGSALAIFGTYLYSLASTKAKSA